jgi:hypothetical protein
MLGRSDQKTVGLLPRWSPELNYGHVGQMLLVAGWGVYITFSVIANMERRIDKVERDAQQRVWEAERSADTKIQAQTAKISMIEQTVANQVSMTEGWRGELREQLKSLNDKLETNNRTLATIQLGLANKVDRRP